MMLHHAISVEGEGEMEKKKKKLAQLVNSLRVLVDFQQLP